MEWMYLLVVMALMADWKCRVWVEEVAFGRLIGALSRSGRGAGVLVLILL